MTVEEKLELLLELLALADVSGNPVSEVGEEPDVTGPLEGAIEEGFVSGSG